MAGEDIKVKPWLRKAIMDGGATGYPVLCLSHSSLFGSGDCEKRKWDQVRPQFPSCLPVVWSGVVVKRENGVGAAAFLTLHPEYISKGAGCGDRESK